MKIVSMGISIWYPRGYPKEIGPFPFFFSWSFDPKESPKRNFKETQEWTQKNWQNKGNISYNLWAIIHVKLICINFAIGNFINVYN
jgi:hypothetical protein